jgi:PAN domain
MRETFSDLRSRARFLLIALATIMLPEGSPAQQTVVLDSYRCAAFLKDVKEPIDGERVIRSLMMIAWATGYAAAHQGGIPRADQTAVRLISATLGDVCRAAPDKKVVLAIVETIDKFARIDTEAQNVPPDKTGPVSSKEFVTTDNADIFGGDYQRTERSDLKTCAASCESDARCKAFSYDKWNRVCFLKGQVGSLLLEPSSVTGVRAGTEIRRAASTVQVEKQTNRSFVGKVSATKASANFQECQRLCLTMSEAECVTFSYIKAGNECRLYSSVEGHNARSGIESGVKRQMP